MFLHFLYFSCFISNLYYECVK